MATQKGRKLKMNIDPHLTDRVCELLEQACSVITACHATGLGESTFHRWVQLGDPDSDSHDPRFREFRERTTRARGLAKAQLVSIVLKHAAADGRIALELLSRLAPDEYGRSRRSEGSQPTSVTERDLTPAELEWMSQCNALGWQHPLPPPPSLIC